MKKILLLTLLAAITMCTFGTFNASAATMYGDMVYTMSSGEVTITDCRTTAKSIVIPKTINGGRVTSIALGAFRDCTALTDITIPDTVTSIGENAFYNCKN